MSSATIGLCALEIDEGAESGGSASWDRIRLEKNFAKPPDDLGEGFGVFSPEFSPSGVGATDVGTSTGAGRSSSSSSSPEVNPSWRIGLSALDRTVPMLSV